MSFIQYRPHDTDERLRTRLDANQVDRERMSQALLALDYRLHDVRPRHPRGGRDGGRDLEARLSDGRVVWASIGFRNMVSDSPADLRWARRKFSDDLKRALTEERAPDGFVFVTNVEFTVSERDTLMQKARKAGFRFVDIFHRERIRILLDGPDGLAVRYQYLGIPLSEAEQAAFFARWGNQLEELISQQFASVDRKLARIEFLHECGNPIRSLYVMINLKRRVAAAELGRFLAVLSILDFDGNSPLLEIDLAVRNAVPVTMGRQFQVLESSMWISPGLFEPDGEEDRNSSIGDPGENELNKMMVASSSMSVLSELEKIGAGGWINGWTRSMHPIPKLADLDGNLLFLSVSAPLADIIDGFRLVANGYIVFEARADEMSYQYLESEQAIACWPTRLPVEEDPIVWVRFSHRDGPAHAVDFSSTPERRATVERLAHLRR